MIPVTFVAIGRWPRRETVSQAQIRALFKVPYERRLAKLSTELEKIRATDVFIQLYLKRDQIRGDGWPYKNARPSAPGVVVTFQRRRAFEKSPRSFCLPCDTYTAWEDNLYAIALSLEALRTVDRYGVTSGHEQYEGFRQITAGPVFDVVWARALIAEYSGQPIDQKTTPAELNRAINRAAAAAHPDRKETGSHDLFVDVIRARDILHEAADAAAAEKELPAK